MNNRTLATRLATAPGLVRVGVGNWDDSRTPIMPLSPESAYARSAAAAGSRGPGRAFRAGARCSGGVWERLDYDWSDPTHIVLKTSDSNTSGGASGYVYTLKRYDDDTTDVDAVIVREGKNLKGRRDPS